MAVIGGIIGKYPRGEGIRLIHVNAAGSSPAFPSSAHGYAVCLQAVDVRGASNALFAASVSTCLSGVRSLKRNLGSYSVVSSGADCKSVVFGLGWCNSITSHLHYQYYHCQPRKMTTENRAETISVLLESVQQ